MTDADTLLPKGLGSACIVRYQDTNVLLTVAHVTNVEAATCLFTGQPVKNNQTPLYSVGAMNYLETFDIIKFEDQLLKLQENSGKKEEIDFGLVDFSYVIIGDNVKLLQRKTDLGTFTIKAGKKSIIQSNLTDIPKSDTEYGFFGRIKPLMIRGTPTADTFETQEVFYSGLRFIREIKNYYEFELLQPIKSNADFKGTSGAPIMDKDGNLVSLVTHGYEGGTKIYGIALSKFRSGVEATILLQRN
jgi:hypothetical protein